MSSRSSGLLSVHPSGAAEHSIRSKFDAKTPPGFYNTLEAGEVIHFSFCKVNSGITVFGLQSNLAGMCFLMRLIGHRATCQIVSHGVGAEIPSSYFISLFFLELLSLGVRG